MDRVHFDEQFVTSTATETISSLVPASYLYVDQKSIHRFN